MSLYLHFVKTKVCAIYVHSSTSSSAPERERSRGPETFFCARLSSINLQDVSVSTHTLPVTCVACNTIQATLFPYSHFTNSSIPCPLYPLHTTLYKNTSDIFSSPLLLLHKNIITNTPISSPNPTQKPSPSLTHPHTQNDQTFLLLVSFARSAHSHRRFPALPGRPPCLNSQHRSDRYPDE